MTIGQQDLTPNGVGCALNWNFWMESEVRSSEILGCVIPSGGGAGSKVDFLPGQIYEDKILPILGIDSLSRLVTIVHSFV